MDFRRTVIGLALATVATAASVSAQAQTPGQITSAPVDLQVFRPASDTKGYITLNGAQVLAPLDVSFGIVTTGAWRPLKLQGGNIDMGGGQTAASSLTIKYLVTTTLQGAVGLFQTDHLGLQLGVGLPIGIVNGEALPSLDNGSGTAPTHYLTNYQGVGDLSLQPKIRLLNPSRVPVGVAIIPGLILPTGDKSKFLGEGQTIFQPQAIVEADWGRHGVFRTALNVGMRLRTGGASQFVDTQDNYKRPVNATTLVPGNTNKGIKVGNELLAGIGASWGIVPFVFDLVGEVYTFTGLDSKKINADGSQSSMGPGGEAVVGIKAYLAPNSFFEMGGGYGVLPTTYGTTQGRIFAGIVFEPGAGDRDGDGLKDDVDKCPDDPEDFDGFEDEDGCPDLDNDKDGIPDVLDKCPNEPGPRENDGCPMHAVHDRDGDGIPDELDKCPDDPEDFDGFEDEDG